MKLTGAKLAEFLGVRADRPICAHTFRVRKVGGVRDWAVPCFVVAADVYRSAARICVSRFLVSFDLDKLIASPSGAQFPSLTDELFSRHSQNLRLPGGGLLRSAKRTNKAGLWWVSGPEECPALERPLTVYEAAFLDSWADWGEGFDPCPREGWRVADGAAAVAARRAAPYPLTVSQLEADAERERVAASVARAEASAKRRQERIDDLRDAVKRWTTKAKRARTFAAKYSRALKRLEKGGL